MTHDRPTREQFAAVAGAIFDDLDRRQQLEQIEPLADIAADDLLARIAADAQTQTKETPK